MRKRKCRLTEEEVSIHNEATRLRKMTDWQLVTAFRLAGEQERCAEGRQPAREAAEETGVRKNTPEIRMLLKAVSGGTIKGIGGATSYKITKYARETGLVE